MKSLNLESYIMPTTVFDDHANCWHPAIKQGFRVIYYKNDSFNTEKAAKTCAEELLKQTEQTLNESLGINTASVIELNTIKTKA